jgi:hypothetical protein
MAKASIPINKVASKAASGAMAPRLTRVPLR